MKMVELNEKQIDYLLHAIAVSMAMHSKDLHYKTAVAENLLKKNFYKLRDDE